MIRAKVSQIITLQGFWKEGYQADGVLWRRMAAESWPLNKEYWQYPSRDYERIGEFEAWAWIHCLTAVWEMGNGL
jgi:hypothetical protein